MTRDILNYLGEVIGQLDLPDDTPEEIWEEKLAKYAAPPAAKQIPDVTPRQMRQALILSGITMEQISTALNSLPEPQKSLAIIEWEYSIVFQRNRPLVAQVALMLGWTDEQLDQLWYFAATL